MFVCIAGNVDAEEIIKKIEAAIKPIEPIEVKRADWSEALAVNSQYVEKKMEVAKPLFCLGFKEECEGERNLKECICSELMLDILSGDTSPFYEEMLSRGLINDEFDSEYFQGNGYATTIFQGESADPKALRDALVCEIERLKTEGIPENIFESARRSLYGTTIKRYNNVEAITMGLVDCAISNIGPFEDIDILRSITKKDVEERLNLLKADFSVLSVILPKR